MKMYSLTVVLVVLITYYSGVNSATYGDLANIEDCAYYAYLTEGFSKNLKCGGAIVGYQFIITAAHCLDDKNFYVYVGISSPYNLDEAKPYRVKDVKKFPWYRNSVWNDVGLIKLTENLVLGPRVQVISLAFISPPIGAEVAIVGFGAIDCTNDVWDSSYYPCGEIGSQHLRSAVVSINSTGYGVLYIEGRNRKNCYSDSGAPVVYKGEVVGIVTTGPHNGCSSQNTLASIPAKYKWLEYNILVTFK